MTKQLNERLYVVYAGEKLYRCNRAILRKTDGLPELLIGQIPSLDSATNRNEQSANEYSSIKEYCYKQGDPRNERLQPNRKALEVTKKPQHRIVNRFINMKSQQLTADSLRESYQKI